jgi:hypothetical protein
MAKIMIRCPVFETAVPTGLTTEEIKIEALSGLTMPLRCPACLNFHKWQMKDVWVDDKEAYGHVNAELQD